MIYEQHNRGVFFKKEKKLKKNHKYKTMLWARDTNI